MNKILKFINTINEKRMQWKEPPDGIKAAIAIALAIIFTPLCLYVLVSLTE